VRLIGLTGGIASGKSTVSRMLKELGATVIDADQLAREVVAPGQPALAEIAARFPGVVGPDGALDRKKLGERIFGDVAERGALNAITHPRIQQRVLELTQGYAEAGVKVVVYDAPLIFENRLDQALEGTILVAASEPVQVARLRARDGLSEEQARARLAAQLSLDEKRKLATWVIDNSGTVEQTRAQVERLWAQLTAPA
jgi:dephospho-CoA kinase